LPRMMTVSEKMPAFPFTPALSRREMENRSAAVAEWATGAAPRAGLHDSLSPRERVGVRGKAIHADRKAKQFLKLL
jgi:hypothetical protein